MTVARTLALFFAMLAVTARPLSAQRPDSTKIAVTEPDTGYAREIKPPISPRKAFVTSLLLPGYGQSVLGRKRSGAMMLAMEALSIVMIRESALGVREARRNAADSLRVAFVDGTGAPVARFERTGFPASLIKARKEHVEDWVAVLVANHLFAATDALVSALLWDLPAEVALTGGRRSTNVGFRLRF